MDKTKAKKNETLSAEEYDKLLLDLEQFEEKFYKILAQTDKYEILPTTLEDGSLVPRDQLSLLVKECHRLGYTVLYKVDVSAQVIILFNPQTMKIGYITEGVH